MISYTQNFRTSCLLGELIGSTLPKFGVLYFHHSKDIYVNLSKGSFNFLNSGQIPRHVIWPFFKTIKAINEILMRSNKSSQWHCDGLIPWYFIRFSSCFGGKWSLPPLQKTTLENQPQHGQQVSNNLSPVAC